MHATALMILVMSANGLYRAPDHVMTPAELREIRCRLTPSHARTSTEASAHEIDCALRHRR